MKPEQGINVAEAYKYLTGKVIRTPVRRLKWLEEIGNVPVWIKLEHYQHTGSFKFRGAMFALRNHPKEIPVIVASAGNHGLAIAYVCQQLRIKVNICLPANASRLKRQRILDLGSGLIEYGSSLDEAIVYAQNLALGNGWRFISPYNDVDLISANGSIAQEFIQDVPDLKYLIIPVGGGGLISGMAIGAQQLNPELKILGCEPENYPSMSRSLLTMNETSVPNIPTYADGLAVNLEKNSITLKLVNTLVEEVITLSEEDLAFGTFALLNKESLLVEPSGCASIAGLIKFFKKYSFDGPVGLPLCGGNIQKNTLNRILEQNFNNSTYVSILDLKGQQLVNAPIIKSFSKTNDRPYPTTNEFNHHFEDLKKQLESIKIEIDALFNDIDFHVKFCSIKNLPIDNKVINSINLYLNDIKDQVENFLLMMNDGHSERDNRNLIEIKIRWALQGISHARTAMEFRASAYDQSNVSQFFSLSSQDNPGVNYDRYFSSEVKRIEDQLCDIFSISRDVYGITLTSSGMAAYSLVEAFLIRYVCVPTSTILVTPYIYFEAKEQLESLKMFKLITARNFSAETLLNHLDNDSSIDVVFADPLANLVEQPMTNIYQLIAGIGKLKDKRPLKLIIDGTMLSGAMVSSFMVIPENLEIIYYESCSKYLQIGLESCLAGVVVYPLKYQAYFERLRRNTGTILYAQQAFSYPRFSKELFINRMIRISNNAVLVTKLIVGNKDVSEKVRIYYPLHETHKDRDIAKLFPYAGGCVTFAFSESGKNNNNFLEAFITKVINNARINSIPLVKGVSFGYSFPRISAASSIAESEYPFLRLYVGDMDRESTQELARIFSETFMHVLDVPIELENTNVITNANIVCVV